MRRHGDFAVGVAPSEHSLVLRLRLRFLAPRWAPGVLVHYFFAQPVVAVNDESHRAKWRLPLTLDLPERGVVSCSTIGTRGGRKEAKFSITDLRAEAARLSAEELAIDLVPTFFGSRFHATDESAVLHQ
jgi:hypothetical protein